MNSKLAPLLLLSSTLIAANPQFVMLGWTDPNTPGDVDSWVVHVSQDNSINYSNWPTVGSVKATSPTMTYQVGLAPGKNFIYVTPSNFWGERLDLPSNVIKTPNALQSGTTNLTGTKM